MQIELRQASEKQLAALLKELGEKRNLVQSTIRYGRPATEILEASKFGSDLIIISTHGHTGLKHVLLGSTAEEVVRHANCPVLVVREKQRDFISR